jgi:hypothetical protein
MVAFVGNAAHDGGTTHDLRGIKASHDGAVAVIDGNRLVVSIESEKVDNNLRYSQLGDLERIPELLQSEGLCPTDIDQFIVDGWWAEFDEIGPSVDVRAAGKPVALQVAPYTETPDARDPLSRHHFDQHHFSARQQGYLRRRWSANGSRSVRSPRRCARARPPHRPWSVGPSRQRGC